MDANYITEYDPERIVTEDDASNAYDTLCAEVGTFHPDDAGAEILNEDGTAPYFTPDQAARYDAVMARIRPHLGEEIYDIAMAYSEPKAETEGAHTGELQEGDVVWTWGMRLRLTNHREYPNYGYENRTIHTFDGVILNKAAVLKEGEVPAGWIADGIWTVQGNDLARWSREVPAGE